MTEGELFEAIKDYYRVDDDRAEVVEAYVNLGNSVERRFRDPEDDRPVVKLKMEGFTK